MSTSLGVAQGLEKLSTLCLHDACSIVTSPHTITSAPPPTPTPNQLLGNYLMALNSQRTCLPAVRTSGLGGSSWDTQISPLVPRRSPASPDGPSKLINSEMLNLCCQPQNLGHHLTTESQGRISLPCKRRGIKNSTART